MKHKTKEFLIIIGCWAPVFVMPAVILLFVEQGSKYGLQEMAAAWSHTIPFFLIHLTHHFLLGPYLWDKRRYKAYGLCVAMILALYTSLQFAAMPSLRYPAPPSKKEKVLVPPPPMNKHSLVSPPPKKKAPRKRHLPVLPPVMGRVFMAILLMASDFGMVSYLRSRKTKQRIQDLERENLKMELDNLKYQLNPHFFMNTLNNIHSLIEIDHEKAQQAIINLSKLLRYALYESNGTWAPLCKEMEVLRLYAELMEMRFDRNVEIKMNLPEDCGDKEIPPLLLVCFVENAFKHGVSNRLPSFIHIDAVLDEDGEHLLFVCQNSMHKTSQAQEHRGIGMENVKKRLSLIYGEEYSLLVKNNDNTFDVCLQIPTTPHA